MKEEDVILGNLLRAVNLLEESPTFARLIPEIRTNLVYALPAATTPSRVAGIKGRITVIDGRARASGFPAFGASSHLARLVITLMKTDPNKRAAINLSYSPEMEKLLKDYCGLKSLLYIKLDRAMEPPQVKTVEGSSMSWTASEAVKKAYGRVPDILVAVGGEGKEPVTIILGQDAVEVAQRALDISQFVKEGKPKPQLETKVLETKVYHGNTQSQPATAQEVHKTPAWGQEKDDLDSAFEWG